MVPGWVPLKIVFDSSALHSRWLLLLKMLSDTTLKGTHPGLV
jgi:hypothetical protein